MHQGKAGLRVPTGLVAAKECFLRALNVSELQSDAAKFGQGPAEFPPQIGRSSSQASNASFSASPGRPAQT